MKNLTFLAAASTIALTCVMARANADNWYVSVNDGTCVSAEFLAKATSGFGWASPFTMADALRAVGVHVDLETTKLGPFQMVAVRIGAVPDEPSLDHANFVYLNNKDTCLKLSQKVHR